MTCTHEWKRREARNCIMCDGPCLKKFSYFRCDECGARRLRADGYDYLITDDDIQPFKESA